MERRVLSKNAFISNISSAVVFMMPLLMVGLICFSQSGYYYFNPESKALERGQLAARYADSLNLWKSKSPLPQFVYDTLLDRRGGYLSTLHDPFSLKKAIFDQVKNINALQEIARSKNIQVNSRPRIEPDTIFPYVMYNSFYKYSIRDLAEMRLAEILKR